MLRSSAVLLLLAAATAFAQTAPITRSAPHRPFVTEPVAGLRILSDAPITTISLSDDSIELRLVHGRATVLVDHPAPDTLLLLDTPGGQVDFVHDGTYTVNAETGVLRVLHGEADVFPPNAPENAAGIPVREGEQVTLAESMHPTQSRDLRADLIGPGQAPPASSWSEPYDYGGGYPAYGYYDWGWSPWLSPGWGWGPWGYSAWGWNPWLYPGWGFGVGFGGPWGWGWPGYRPIYPRRFPGGFAGPGRSFPPRGTGLSSRGFSPGTGAAPSFRSAPSGGGRAAGGFHGGAGHR